MKTLEALINEGSQVGASQISKAIAAAYWAGQSDVRAEERLKALTRRNEFVQNGLGRYHKKVKEALDTLLPNLEIRSINGLVEEAEEIKQWTFKGI